VRLAPQVLTQVSSSSIVALILEVIVLRLGMYALSIDACPLTDLVAYSGYKYVGLVLNTLAGMTLGSMAYYLVSTARVSDSGCVSHWRTCVWLVAAAVLFLLMRRALPTGDARRRSPGLQALLYTGMATAFFVINTLNPVVRPEVYHGGSVGGRASGSQKNYFVIGAGALQLLMMWWLGSSSDL
jgi:hypothetical protein